MCRKIDGPVIKEWRLRVSQDTSTWRWYAGPSRPRQRPARLGETDQIGDREACPHRSKARGGGPANARTYPLSEVSQAIDYVGAGHAQGKVVITV